MSKKKHRDLELFVVDVFVAIQKIKTYIAPFANEEAFRHNSLHWDATIRQLEIIGEALNKLLEDEQFNAVSPTYFRKIVNFRNVIAHGYFGIDLDEVWNVVSEKLDILGKDLRAVVNSGMDIMDAIESAIGEYRDLDDNVIVTFLKNLKKDLDLVKTRE